MEKCSVYADSRVEVEKHKWILSERAGYDMGEVAVRDWVKQHWDGYLRERWLEHLEGKRFWVELDCGDFGLFKQRFQDQQHLLDRILDRLKSGKENLDIILWALDFHICMHQVLDMLEALDINSRRLQHRFDC
ncbi:MAG: DUF4032 domain-containing protein [Gemmataceae bacterium]|nr:DUF4032 domain-containing protein [Gemmataceae bacterium]MCI0742617.1 DUF4032 domain-containing protein [Gemmataceae bacterium]